MDTSLKVSVPALPCRRNFSLPATPVRQVWLRFAAGQSLTPRPCSSTRPAGVGGGLRSRWSRLGEEGHLPDELTCPSSRGLLSRAPTPCRSRGSPPVLPSRAEGEGSRFSEAPQERGLGAEIPGEALGTSRGRSRQPCLCARPFPAPWARPESNPGRREHSLRQQPIPLNASFLRPGLQRLREPESSREEGTLADVMPVEPTFPLTVC